MARYCIDGIEFPSPTEVLGILDKPALKQWAVNMAIRYLETQNFMDNDDPAQLLQNAKTEWKNVSEEAMDIGSEIHAIIENYIKFGQDALGQYRSEVENGFLAFLEWEKEHITKWFCSEMIVVSHDYGFAGQLDAIAEMRDDKTSTELVRLLDFKSSSGFYSGYGKQLCLYRTAINEMIRRKIKVERDGPNLITKHHNWDLPPIKGIGILRLDKTTGAPEFRNYDKIIDRKTKAALKLLDYYYQDKKRRLKNQRRAK